MELRGAKTLVCGATGDLGRQIAASLHAEGANVAVAGRNESTLAEVATDLGDAPSVVLDVVDQASSRKAVDDAVEALGGLDLLVVAVGSAGFGAAIDTEPAVAEELFAVNTLGPMEVIRAACRHLQGGGTVAAISAILADVPTAQMAEYSASKSAFSAWLRVLRQEQRRKPNVLDIRPPHLDTDLVTRALAGEPPRLPEPRPASELVETVVRAIREDAKEVTYDFKAKELRVS